jgi:lipopolysaccharide/colanic/teichoic acid biosynthesis glycosyltransferase
MIRFFDFIFSLIGLLLLSPILLVLLIIGYFDTGSPVFCQERVGKNKQPFLLYKLRSMHLDIMECSFRRYEFSRAKTEFIQSRRTDTRA